MMAVSKPKKPKTLSSDNSVPVPSPSEHWIPISSAVEEVIAKLQCSQGEAFYAICRRLISLIPAKVDHWFCELVEQDSRDIEIFKDHYNDMTHFSSAPSPKAYHEILGFFDILGKYSNNCQDNSTPGVSVQLCEIASGDFIIDFSIRFSVMRRTAIGVHVDRAALTKAFGLYSESKLSNQKGGRPPKYDWEGSLIDIIAQANTPDGLPEGPGAQAKIENMMSEWFIARTGEGPAISEVRRRAKRVMEAISKVDN